MQLVRLVQYWSILPAMFRQRRFPCGTDPVAKSTATNLHSLNFMVTSINCFCLMGSEELKALCTHSGTETVAGLIPKEIMGSDDLLIFLFI